MVDKRKILIVNAAIILSAPPAPPEIPDFYLSLPKRDSYQKMNKGKLSKKQRRLNNGRT